jgi:hypothetical protein
MPCETYCNSAHDIDSLNTAALSGTSVIFRGGKERSLRGFDGEIGWRVPIFAGDAMQQLRIYGGAYKFYADEVNKVQGPRGRAEWTFDEIPQLWEGSRFTLGTEVQNDGPRGTQAFAVARLRVPLQLFGEPVSKLTPMERRMADPTVRDVDIISRAGAFGPQETATTTASGRALTVLSSATTTGAAMPGAVTAAGANSTVILSGSFTTTGTTTLNSGQTLMGGGALSVRSPSGRLATVALPTATITGNVGAANVTLELANNSTVTGLTINASDATNSVFAIRAAGVSGATVSNSTITATTAGGAGTRAVIINTASSNVTLSGNSITATGGASALAVEVGNSSVTVTGNTLSASGTSGLNAYAALSTATILTGSSGNTAGSGSCSNAGGNTGQISFTNTTTCP